MSDLHLTMLKCGDLKFTGADGVDVLIPVPWFHISHPKGDIVIAGGNALEVVSDARGHWGAVVESFTPTMTEADFCVNTLATHGLDPERVRYVNLLGRGLHRDGFRWRGPSVIHHLQLQLG